MIYNYQVTPDISNLPVNVVFDIIADAVRSLESNNLVLMDMISAILNDLDEDTVLKILAGNPDMICAIRDPTDAMREVLKLKRL